MKEGIPMAVKTNANVDRSVFGRTATNIHTMNIRGYAKRGGIRL